MGCWRPGNDALAAEYELNGFSGRAGAVDELDWSHCFWFDHRWDIRLAEPESLGFYLLRKR